MGICLCGGHFDEYLLVFYFLLGGVCAFWGAYVPYRLARLTGNAFDLGIIIVSLISAVLTPILFYLIFPLFFGVLRDSYRYYYEGFPEFKHLRSLRRGTIWGRFSR